MSHLSPPNTGGNDAHLPRSPSAVLDALSDRRRRDVLAVLTDRGPTAESELTAALAPDGDADDRARIRISLHHVHLPELADADLVARDPESRTVSATDHPVFGTPAFGALVRDRDRSASDDALDAALSALADPRRRTTMAVLRTAGRPLAEAEVAERVAVRERDPESGDVVGLMADLRHVHLPSLARSGLADYDAEARRVVDSGHPVVEETWLGTDLRAGADRARVRDEPAG